MVVAGYNSVIMKVVFLKDVGRVARAGDIKEVADGYGRNFLLPKKLAMLATPSAIKAAEVHIQKDREQEQRFATEAEKLAQQLEGVAVTFKAKVAEQDHLYGSIRDSDIADELNKLTGLDIDKKKIQLEEPIRLLGEHAVIVRLSKDLTATIKVIIAPEE